MRLALLLLVLAGCPRPVPPPVPPGPADAAAASCASMCARLADLGCPAAKPTPEGASCEKVCQNVQDSGLILWNLECRTRAPTCAAIDECER